jgi:hypothetical protein
MGIRRLSAELGVFFGHQPGFVLGGMDRAERRTA